MIDRSPQDVALLMEDGAAVDASLRRAFEQTVRRHQQLGLPLVVWRDGQVEEIPPDHLAPAPDVAAGERIEGVGIADVRCTDDALVVDLVDGRTIITPLAWYPRLLHATPAQRARWEKAGAGFGVHWPELDEDLSVRGMLRGAPSAPGTVPGGAPTPAASAA